MSSYIIAGSADQEDTAKCEYIAQLIQKIQQGIDFRIVIKHPKDWSNYITEICRTYGYKKKFNPIIFKTDGHLIGNKQDFENYCQKNFGVAFDQYDDKQRNQNTNQDIAEEEYNQRMKQEKKKTTLFEKINSKLKHSLQNQRILAAQGFYTEQIDNGFKFYVKNESKIKPFIEIPLVKQLKQQEVIEESTDIDMQMLLKKDYYEQTEEEQKKLEKAHKQEKLEEKSLKSKENNNNQVIKQQLTHLGSKEQIEELNKLNLENLVGNQQQDQILQVTQEEQMAAQQGKNILENNQQQDLKSQGQASVEVQALSDQDNNVVQSEFVPVNIKMNDYIIKKLKNKYYLALHPQPQMMGQCIIFQALKQRENDEVNYYYQDYSQVIRDRQNSFFIDFKAKEQEKKSYMFQAIDNIFYPLSQIDWQKILKFLQKVEGIVFYQVLPFQKKNFYGYSSYSINAIPKQFMLDALNNEIFTDQNTQFKELPFEKYLNEASVKIKYLKIKKQYLTKLEKAFEEKEKAFIDLQAQNLENEQTQKIENVQNQQQQQQQQSEQQQQQQQPQEIQSPTKQPGSPRPMSPTESRVNTQFSKDNKDIKVQTQGSRPASRQIQGSRPISQAQSNRPGSQSARRQEEENQSPVLNISNKIDRLLNKVERTDKKIRFWQNKYFKFDHLIYKLDATFYSDNGKLKEKKIMKMYRNMAFCFQYDLNHNIEQSGFNIIITNKFLFMAPLEAPFDKQGDVNVFVYPLIYYGFAHIPVLKILWPNTAKQQDQNDANIYKELYKRLQISTIPLQQNIQ